MVLRGPDGRRGEESVVVIVVVVVVVVVLFQSESGVMSVFVADHAPGAARCRSSVSLSLQEVGKCTCGTSACVGYLLAATAIVSW